MLIRVSFETRETILMAGLTLLNLSLSDREIAIRTLLDTLTLLLKVIIVSIAYRTLVGLLRAFFTIGRAIETHVELVLYSRVKGPCIITISAVLVPLAAAGLVLANGCPRGVCPKVFVLFTLRAQGGASADFTVLDAGYALAIGLFLARL